jgi:cyclase
MSTIRDIIFLIIIILSPCLISAQSDSVQISVTPLNDHISMITCKLEYPTNQIVSVGSDGILLIDAGITQTAPKLLETLHQMGNGKVRLLINTHTHDDHTSGNRVMLNEVVSIAQRNARDRLTGSYFSLPPLPSPDAEMMVFDDSLTLWFNGEEIRVLHIPDAHSDGDAVVYFVNSKILCVGDLVFPDIIPFVDLSIGGVPLNYIENIKWLAENFPPETKFVAGHGRPYSKQDMLANYDMLQKTRDIVKQGMASGKTIEQMQKDSILSAWNSYNGQWSTTTTSYWIATLAVGMSSRTGSPIISICKPLSATIVKDGVALAVKQYHDLKTSQPDRYDFGENELNNLGYNLVWRNRLTDAIEIFKLNTEAYPNSGNVFDSYGESLLANGDTTQARINYQKSLKLNPKNTNAERVLKTIKKK